MAVLKVLNDVPHIAWLNCRQKENEGYYAFCSSVLTPLYPRRQSNEPAQMRTAWDQKAGDMS